MNDGARILKIIKMIFSPDVDLLSLLVSKISKLLPVFHLDVLIDCTKASVFFATTHNDEVPAFLEGTLGSRVDSQAVMGLSSLIQVKLATDISNVTSAGCRSEEAPRVKNVVSDQGCFFGFLFLVVFVSDVQNDFHRLTCPRLFCSQRLVLLLYLNSPKHLSFKDF